MKNRYMIKGLSILIILAAFAIASVIPAMATTHKTFQMRGKITAVDVTSHTVVINVPIGKKKVFTVAGPLASNALLRKDHRNVTLKDFHKGESVSVKWQYTKEGHLIKALIAR